MFQVSLVDHVRLSFATVLSSYEAHAAAAARLARWNSYSKLAMMVISGVTVIIATVAAQAGSPLQIATAVLSGAVFICSAAYVALNHQPLIYGHRVSAARLWVVCEKYRALLAEMHDGAIDPDLLPDRRNALIAETAAVLETAAPDDRFTFEIARQSLAGPNGAGYPDAVIDRYLPAGLRKEPPVTAPVQPHA